MPNQGNIKLAHVVILLNQERATEGVMHALALLDSVLPPLGTPERREAFAAAQGDIARANAREKVS